MFTKFGLPETFNLHKQQPSLGTSVSPGETASTPGNTRHPDAAIVVTGGKCSGAGDTHDDDNHDSTAPTPTIANKSTKQRWAPPKSSESPSSPVKSAHDAASTFSSSGDSVGTSSDGDEMHQRLFRLGLPIPTTGAATASRTSRSSSRSSAKTSSSGSERNIPTRTSATNKIVDSADLQLQNPCSNKVGSSVIPSLSSNKRKANNNDDVEAPVTLAKKVKGEEEKGTEDAVTADHTATKMTPDEMNAGSSQPSLKADIKNTRPSARSTPPEIPSFKKKESTSFDNSVAIGAKTKPVAYEQTVTPPPPKFKQMHREQATSTASISGNSFVRKNETSSTTTEKGTTSIETEAKDGIVEDPTDSSGLIFESEKKAVSSRVKRGMPTDYKDSLVMTLPTKQAQMISKYPPNCPVLVNDDGAKPPVWSGCIDSVFIDVSPNSNRSLQYRVKPDQLVKPTGHDLVVVEESKLRFGPGCTVIVTAQNEKEGAKGVVTFLCDNFPKEGNGQANTTYTVYIEESKALKHGIEPENITFFPGALDVEDNATHLLLAGKRVPKHPVSKEGNVNNKSNENLSRENVSQMAPTNGNGPSEISKGIDVLKQISDFTSRASKGKVSSASPSLTPNGPGVNKNEADVAITVGIVRGLDLDKVRISIYGDDMTINEKMKEKLGVVVRIVGIGFDHPDPSWIVDGQAGSTSGRYVIIIGPRKNVDKALKVIVHLLTEASSGVYDQDSIKKELKRATKPATCEFINSTDLEEGEIQTEGYYHMNNVHAATSGEDQRYYASTYDAHAEYGIQSVSTKPPSNQMYFSSSGEYTNNETAYTHDSTPKFHEFEMKFPSWCDSSAIAKKIIGSNGENISRLEAASRAQITFYGNSTRRESHLQNLMCYIRGAHEDVQYAKMIIEITAVQATNNDSQARLMYDLAVAYKYNGGEYDWASNPREGATMYHQWNQDPTELGLSPSSEANYFMKSRFAAIIDLSMGVVERPSIILLGIEGLEDRTGCKIMLYGAGKFPNINEPYVHISGKHQDDVEECVREIHNRLSSA